MDAILILFKKDKTRRDFNLSPGKTIIGRQEDCDLRIPLAEISRKHAMVVLDEETVLIRDMGSANGTYVNNQRVTEQELSAGDHVVIGPVVFTVQIDGEPAEIRPAVTKAKPRPLSREVAGTQQSGGGREDYADKEFFDEGEDPISALESLAGTGDTEAFDINDMDLGLSDSFPAEEEEGGNEKSGDQDQKEEE
jgi:pSer/pThr/pTyr-binding forkhead associated (FHA) protein